MCTGVVCSEKPFTKLQAVIFDWAGTTVDYGCQGPVQAFVGSFAKFGIVISPAEAREPMGMDKRQHVATLCAMPRIASLWESAYGALPTDLDIDALYQDVENSMVSCITQFSVPIEGTLEAVQTMRRRGLRIGSCTGYPRTVGVELAKEALKYGFEPDLMVCATDVPQGRPAPDMCQSILATFGVHNPARAVKIGDTVNDVLEGIHAGMWVIGISLSGSMAGLGMEEVKALTAHERDALDARIAGELRAAGAHYTAPDVRSCLPLLDRIEAKCQEGINPEHGY